MLSAIGDPCFVLVRAPIGEPKRTAGICLELLRAAARPKFGRARFLKAGIWIALRAASAVESIGKPADDGGAEEEEREALQDHVEKAWRHVVAFRM
jgi:hypothetical protein